MTGRGADGTGTLIEVLRTLSAEHVRALQSLDTSFVTDRSYRVSATARGFELVEEPLATPLRKRYELRQGEPPWDLVVLAGDGGGLSGMAATTYEAWNRRQVLNELHVAPDQRRRGLARRLLTEVHHAARENGARELWVETQNVNVPAVRAYRRLGFRLTGIDLSRYPPPQDGEVALFLSCPVASIVADPTTRSPS